MIFRLNISLDNTSLVIHYWCVRLDMDTMNLIRALNDAVKLLHSRTIENRHESMAIFNLTSHAERHLDEQIVKLLRDREIA